MDLFLLLDCNDNIITCFRLDVNNLKQVVYNVFVYARIKELREESGFTQKQLSKELGMSQTGYSKYETGENDIPTAILIKLAAIHDVTVGYLLGTED